MGRRRSRPKRIPREELKEVLRRSGRPVELMGDAIPSFLRGIPDATRAAIIASGQTRAPDPRSPESIAGETVGGIDVYRHSPDDPVLLNRDWYRVRSSTTEYIADGPLPDGEHWLNTIPSRLNGVEVIGSGEEE